MMRIALAQVNPTVGDLDGNRQIVQDAIEQAMASGAGLVAFPELVITGYPPEDLLLKRSFVEDNLAALSEIGSSTSAIVAVVGFVDSEAGGLYNAAAVIADGQVRGVYRKHHLPNYGVFDEHRYFQPGEGLLLGQIGDLVFGVTVCEDLWADDGPHVSAASAGASLIININGSPYHMGKGSQREALIRDRAMRHGVTIAYVNAVGGQDELVFDGQSLVISPQGELLARAAQFQDEMLLVDLHESRTPSASGRTTSNEGLLLLKLPTSANPPNLPASEKAPELDEEAEVWAALVTGVRDYLAKNSFERAIVGISGGIDSALTAAIGVEALGPDRLLGVFNPSEFTSTQSYEDAEALAKNLGIQLVTLPIDDAYQSMRKTLDPLFAGTGGAGGVAAPLGTETRAPEAANPPNQTEDVAEENLQSRIRGNLWMAITNKFGGIVLSTGNKSEMAVGYATLYGDMAGGFAVLKDVPKTLVYRLARWRNEQSPIIPQRIIDRAPTAELRTDQLDTDSLPPYEILDPILQAYVEEDLSLDEIVARGFDASTVQRVALMVDRAEYKRRQAPPGIKITERAFGRDRRLPITNRYRLGGTGGVAAPLGKNPRAPEAANPPEST